MWKKAAVVAFFALLVLPTHVSAGWRVHSTTYVVKSGDTLTKIAMNYVAENTPLVIYREALVELNYALLSEREDMDVRPGDVLVVNYWVNEEEN
jgi:hypothetical protein